MEKYTYDEKNGLPYELTSDYYLPCLKAPEAPQAGVWGHRRRTYLWKHNMALYTAMLLSRKLDVHLESVDRDAAQMFDFLIKQLAEQEGIVKDLKAQDQMEWVQRMKSIRNVAEEIVNGEVIFA